MADEKLVHSWDKNADAKRRPHYLSKTFNVNSPLHQHARELFDIVCSIESMPPERITPDLWEKMNKAQAFLQDLKIEWAESRASPKQAEAASLVRDRKIDLLACVGANRSGKSITAGWLSFAWHLRDRAKDGELYWCVAPTYEKAVSGVQWELWRALPRPMFTTESWNPRYGFNPQGVLRLALPHGRGSCTVKFKYEEQGPNTFESDKVSGIWWDEATKEWVLDRIIARVVDRNGFILISTLPDEAWLRFRVRLSNNKRWKYQHFVMEDNRANLPPGAIERALNEFSSEEAKMRVYGLESSLSDVVYREFDADVHVCKPFPKGIPKAWPKWMALDYGYANPTACLWFAIAPDETVFVYREYYNVRRSISQNAEGIIRMCQGESYQDKCIIDQAAYHVTAANTVSIADQYAVNGLAVRPSINTARMGEHAMVDRVRKRLEVGMIKVWETCPNLIREFQSWRFKKDAMKKFLAGDKYEDKDNHALDALKYFVSEEHTYTTGRSQVISTVTD